MLEKQLHSVAAALALAALLVTGSAAAQGWQKKYPVVKYGVIPVETQTSTTKTMDGFLKHAEKETGAKWELYTATDYSGVMNALIAGQINLAWLSGFSYCQTNMDSKGGVEPLVAASEPDGSMGYFAVIVVKTESPYKSFEDLKGKVVARTDPLSDRLARPAKRHHRDGVPAALQPGGRHHRDLESAPAADGEGLL